MEKFEMLSEKNETMEWGDPGVKGAEPYRRKCLPALNIREIQIGEGSVKQSDLVVWSYLNRDISHSSVQCSVVNNYGLLGM